MTDEHLVRLLEMGFTLAVVGFALGYAAGRRGARIVRVPVDELGAALFPQRPALA